MGLFSMIRDKLSLKETGTVNDIIYEISALANQPNPRTIDRIEVIRDNLLAAFNEVINYEQYQNATGSKAVRDAIKSKIAQLLYAEGLSSPVMVKHDVGYEYQLRKPIPQGARGNSAFIPGEGFGMNTERVQLENIEYEPRETVFPQLFIDKTKRNQLAEVIVSAVAKDYPQILSEAGKKLMPAEQKAQQVASDAPGAAAAAAAPQRRPT